MTKRWEDEFLVFVSWGCWEKDFQVPSFFWAYSRPFWAHSRPFWAYSEPILSPFQATEIHCWFADDKNELCSDKSDLERWGFKCKRLGEMDLLCQDAWWPRQTIYHRSWFPLCRRFRCGWLTRDSCGLGMPKRRWGWEWVSVDGIPTEMLKLLSRRTGTGVFVFEDGVLKNLKLFSMIPIKTRKKYTIESEKIHHHNNNEGLS